MREGKGTPHPNLNEPMGPLAIGAGREGGEVGRGQRVNGFQSIHAFAVRTRTPTSFINSGKGGRKGVTA